MVLEVNLVVLNIEHGVIFRGGDTLRTHWCWMEVGAYGPCYLIGYAEDRSQSADPPVPMPPVLLPSYSPLPL